MPNPSSLRPKRLQSRHARPGQWYVSIPAGLSPTGKRQRLFFTTRLEAENECELLKTRRINFGHSLASLSAERIAEAAACYRRLAETAPDVSLSRAVDDFLEQYRITNASVTLTTLWARFLDSKAGASPDYRQELAGIFKKLEPILGSEIASTLRASQIESALEGFPPAYRNAALRYLRAAFNFGIRSGWLRENPVKRLEFTKIVRDHVEVIEPKTVEKLLLDALAHDLELLPFLVLAFYAGIRPEGELDKILWTDIDLSAKEHHVTIRPTVAKKRRKRWIDLAPNALAWLGEYRDRGGKLEGPVVPFSAATLRRKRRRNALAAGITSWPQQGARHTYCSCWLRQHGDINKLVLQAGHESPQVLWNHYYQAVSPEAAAAFWAIYPPIAEEGRIIAFIP